MRYPCLPDFFPPSMTLDNWVQPSGERSFAQVHIAAVPVEVDDVVRTTGLLGVLKFLLELLVRRRPQGRDVEPSEVIAKVLKKAVGYRAEGDVVGSARTADHVQEANASFIGFRHRYEAEVGIGLDADEGLHAKGDRRVGLGIAHEFPRNGSGFRDLGFDLDPQVREFVQHAIKETLNIAGFPQAFSRKARPRAAFMRLSICSTWTLSTMSAFWR